MKKLTFRCAVKDCHRDAVRDHAVCDKHLYEQIIITVVLGTLTVWSGIGLLVWVIG